ncbi:MAG: Na+:solute symporter [Candidatus Brocadiae bacterium]|nr:Na+:solute symporter [Candidatus Brocadiia bacterium]
MLSWIDWVIIAAYCGGFLGLGIYFKSRSGKSLSEFFLAGKSLPWWLAGTSMAAAAFSADTPLYVTALTRDGGIAANWQWWSFAFCHAISVFLYARLWRRSGVMTENEFAEIRYSGKPAAFLRGFKAFLFAVPMNCILMGGLPTLGLAKVLEGTVGWSPWVCIGFACAVAFTYTLLSGFWGVVYGELIQFGLAIVGCTVLAVLAVQHAGGMEAMKAGAIAARGAETLNFVPEFGWTGSFIDSALAVFLMYIGIQWWSNKNANAGGVLVQRMAACRTEQHALGATLWFNVAHYAVRAWPWIVCAIASLALYPGLKDGQLAYPMLMRDLLPVGLRGLMIAAFLAAYMGTINSQLNWGASYLTNDLYKRFVNPEASDGRCLWVSRVLMGALLAISAGVTWLMVHQPNGLVKTFQLLITMQAGTGLVYLLRWYWWRISAWSEIAAVAGSVVVACTLYGLEQAGVVKLNFVMKMLTTVSITTILWLLAAYLLPGTDMKKLEEFFAKVRPSGPGWRAVAWRLGLRTEPGLGRDLADWGIGLGFVFGLTFGIGKLCFFEWGSGALMTGGGLAAGVLLLARSRPRPAGTILRVPEVVKKAAAL